MSKKELKVEAGKLGLKVGFTESEEEIRQKIKEAQGAGAQMNFRDAVAADLDNVFFNEKEFAESVIIDGKPVPIILDNNALQGMSELYAKGLSEGEQFIFIKEKDMHRLPQPGEELTKDGKQWYIRHAVSEMGVFGLRIGREQLYD